MDTIATYMDDEIREKIHNEYAPCSNEYFLEKYIEQDSAFNELLQREFRIELWGDDMTIEELYFNCANLTSESNIKVVNYVDNKTLYEGKGFEIPENILQLDVEIFRIRESSIPQCRFDVRIIVLI